MAYIKKSDAAKVSYTDTYNAKRDAEKKETIKPAEGHVKGAELSPIESSINEAMECLRVLDEVVGDLLSKLDYVRVRDVNVSYADAPDADKRDVNESELNRQLKQIVYGINTQRSRIAMVSHELQL